MKELGAEPEGGPYLHPTLSGMDVAHGLVGGLRFRGLGWAGDGEIGLAGLIARGAAGCGGDR
jgi:hypothetical protein